MAGSPVGTARQVRRRAHWSQRVAAAGQPASPLKRGDAPVAPLPRLEGSPAGRGGVLSLSGARCVAACQQMQPCGRPAGAIECEQGLSVGAGTQDEANPELQRLRQGLAALATQGAPGLSAPGSSLEPPASSDAVVATVTAAAPAAVWPRPGHRRSYLQNHRRGSGGAQQCIGKARATHLDAGPLSCAQLPAHPAPYYAGAGSLEHYGIRRRLALHCLARPSEVRTRGPSRVAVCRSSSRQQHACRLPDTDATRIVPHWVVARSSRAAFPLVHNRRNRRRRWSEERDDPPAEAEAAATDTPASPETPAPHSRTGAAAAAAAVASPAASTPGVRALVAELTEATNRINDLYSTMVEASPTTGGGSPSSGRRRDAGADGGCTPRAIFVLSATFCFARDVLETSDDFTL